jgi:hypothetical protein
MEVASLLAGPRHRQTTLSCGSGTVLVDSQLSEILAWCWSQGLSTEFSCQGEAQDKAYIMFSSAQHAEKFLELTAAMGGRLLEAARSAQPHAKSLNRRWELVCFPVDDLNQGHYSPQGGRRLKSRIRVSVLMPNSDLELLKKAIAHASRDSAN